MKKIQLKRYLDYRTHDACDGITFIGMTLIDSIESNCSWDLIQHDKYNQQLYAIIGSLHCIRDIRHYFNIKNTNNPIYNLIYSFIDVKDLESCLSVIHNNLLIPNDIKDQEAYTIGYEKIIKRIKEDLL